MHSLYPFGGIGFDSDDEHGLACAGMFHRGCGVRDPAGRLLLRWLDDRLAGGKDFVSDVRGDGAGEVQEVAGQGVAGLRGDSWHVACHRGGERGKVRRQANVVEVFVSG